MTQPIDPSEAENAALMDALERSIPPMNTPDAERLLRDAKRIFDGQGVVFFLRQGTCLGAVRDGALIPWDDDLDLGSIIDAHGFSEEMIEPTAQAFREIDCYVDVNHEGLYTSVRIFRDRIRIDWQCYRVVQGTIAHYPGVPFPARLFMELAEVEFLDDTYHVPSPPEEYLTIKYGPDWVTPKRVGYEKDVLDNMPAGTVPGRAGWLRRFLAVHFRSSHAATLRVLDADGEAVSGADIRIAGLGRCKSNRRGYARFYLPGADHYAVVVTVGGREEVLYEEALEPGKTYVYRPDPEVEAGRYFILTEE
jgi:hypothetical protein